MERVTLFFLSSNHQYVKSSGARQNKTLVRFVTDCLRKYFRFLGYTEGSASLCLPCTFKIRHISFLSMRPKYHILIGLNNVKACDWRLYFYVRLLIIYSRHYDWRSTYLDRKFILFNTETTFHIGSFYLE